MGTLTPKEFEILSLIKDGLEVPEISMQLRITKAVVIHHLKTILIKLSHHARTEAKKYTKLVIKGEKYIYKSKIQ